MKRRSWSRVRVPVPGHMKVEDQVDPSAEVPRHLTTAVEGRSATADLIS